MPYRFYPPSLPEQVVRDPVRDLPRNHLARLVERVVEEVVGTPSRPDGPGNPPYDPRLCLKVLVYGYATGTRSSRALERLCEENLAYLFLTRGDTPTYRTLCTARIEQKERMEEIFLGLFTIAEALGMNRVGHLVIDATKIRANASPEAVAKREEFAALRQELEQILAEAVAVDEQEAAEGYPGETRLPEEVQPTQMRAIVRRVRRRRLPLRPRKQPAAPRSLAPGRPRRWQKHPCPSPRPPARRPRWVRSPSESGTRRR
jgi:transposase